jgi:exonuclease III
VKSWHKQKEKVIVMWDANDSLLHKSLQEFQTQTELISLIQYTPDEVSTYTRGTKVIEHILGSRDLLQNVTKSGYIPFYEGAWISDHQPAFIDLQIHMTQPQ